MTFVLHCGGKPASLSDVLAVPVPQRTESYAPVSYGDAIDLMRHEVGALGLQVRREAFGLGCDGEQLFGLLTLDTGNSEHGLSIGLRQSYNKTLALGVAVGAQVFVCDNLAFSGSAFKVVRKNTTNVWRDFRGLLREQVANALPAYQRLEADFDAMRAISVSEERGYAVLGVMVGKELLTPAQANVAFGDWRTARHAEFDTRTLWGLYNCVTEGLKKGGAGRVLDRHAAAHDYVVDTIPLLARRAQATVVAAS